ncbi:MAG: hypothetical protein ABI780_09905 [Ardenticatenales bacterium]
MRTVRPFVWIAAWAMAFLALPAASGAQRGAVEAQQGGSIDRAFSLVGVSGGSVAGIVSLGDRMYAAVGVRLIALEQGADGSLAEVGSSNPTDKLLGRLAASDGFVYALGGKKAGWSHLDDTVVYAFDVTDPAAPRQTARFDPAGTAEGIAAHGRFVLLAVGDDGLVVLQRSAGGQLSVAARLTNVAGVRAVEWTGDVALVGTASADQGGVVVIDMTDPTHPVPRGSVTGLGPVLTILRKGGIAFVGTGIVGRVADGTGGVQTLDVSSVDEPHRIGSLANVLSNGGTLGVASLAVDGVDVIWLAAPEPESGTIWVTVADGLDPARLRVIRSWAMLDGRMLMSAANRTFIGSGDEGLYSFVLDDAGKPNLTRVAVSAYSATAVAYAGLRGLVGGSHGEVVAVDVTDRSRMLATGRAQSFLRNEITGVAARPSGIVAVQSQSFLWPFASIDRFDIETADALRQSGTQDVDGYAEDIEVAGEVAFVATRGSDIGSVLAYDVSGPAQPILNPDLIGAFQRPTGNDDALGLSLTGSSLFVATSDRPSAAAHGALIRLDISNPLALTMRDALELPGRLVDVASTGDLVIAAAGDAGMWIVDTADPVTMRVEAHMQGVAAYRVVMDGNTAYAIVSQPGGAGAAGDGAAIVAIDLSDPTRPREVARFTTPLIAARSFGQGLAIAGGDLLVAAGDAGLLAYRLDTEYSARRLWLPVGWRP